MKINRTILIVEDEEKLRTTVSDFLKLYDYNIIEAKMVKWHWNNLKKTFTQLT